jgi:hypothetical protein
MAVSCRWPPSLLCHARGCCVLMGQGDAAALGP